MCVAHLRKKTNILCLLAAALALAACDGGGDPRDTAGDGLADLPADPGTDPGTDPGSDPGLTDVRPDAGPDLPPDAGDPGPVDVAGDDPSPPDPGADPGRDPGTDPAGDEGPGDLPSDPGADDAPGPLDVPPDPADDPGPADVPADVPPAPRVAVNEVVAAAPNLGPDWVELVNPGTAAVDLSGWSLKDDDDAHIFTFPTGTTLAAGAFLVVEGPGGVPPLLTLFGFGKSDSARIFDPEGNLVDQAVWVDGQAPLGNSWGRYPDGTGPFATLLQPTRGSANVPPP